VHHAAAELMRTEQRRQRREKEASVMLEPASSPIAEDDWSRLKPVLNEVVGELGDAERDAILLRFYQKHSLVEIGAMLHVSEDAAQKRVTRGLEKMRAGLVRRGISSTSAALGLMLQNHAVVAAPASLLGTVTQGALASAGTSGVATVLSWAMGKVSLGVAAVAALAGATAIVLRHPEQASLPGDRPVPPLEQATALSRAASIPVSAGPDAPPAGQPADAQPAAETRPVTVESPPARVPRRSYTPNQMQQWLAVANDPQAIARLAAQGRELTLKRYSYLIDEFTLTAAEKEGFLQLLDDKRQAPLDLFVASLQQGVDLRNDLGAFDARIAAETAAIEKKIRALLGDERYREYQAYNRQLNQETIVQRFDALVRGTENALTPVQAAQLEQLLRVQAAPAQMITAARGFLSPAQVEALRDVFSIKQAVRTRLPDDVPPSDDGQP
jgi:hypothetical protein